MKEKELTRKEERFCREYIIDYNGTAAAVRSGYSEKNAAAQACKLLKKAEVLDFIRLLQKEQCERLCISADWVLLKLTEIVGRCMQATPVKEWDYSKHRWVETGTFEFDAKNANKALEMIAQRTGFGDSGSAVSPEKQAAFNGLISAFRQMAGEDEQETKAKD